MFNDYRYCCEGCEYIVVNCGEKNFISFYKDLDELV